VLHCCSATACFLLITAYLHKRAFIFCIALACALQECFHRAADGSAVKISSRNKVLTYPKHYLNIAYTVTLVLPLVLLLLLPLLLLLVLFDWCSVMLHTSAVILQTSLAYAKHSDVPGCYTDAAAPCLLLGVTVNDITNAHIHITFSAINCR
jgi:hypothetical protein